MSELEQYLAGEIDKAYALEMTKAVLRSEAVATDRDVIEFAAVLGILPSLVTRRCRNGIWGGW